MSDTPETLWLPPSLTRGEQGQYSLYADQYCKDAVKYVPATALEAKDAEIERLRVLLSNAVTAMRPGTDKELAFNIYLETEAALNSTPQEVPVAKEKTSSDPATEPALEAPTCWRELEGEELFESRDRLFNRARGIFHDSTLVELLGKNTQELKALRPECLFIRSLMRSLPATRTV